MEFRFKMKYFLSTCVLLFVVISIFSYLKYSYDILPYLNPGTPHCYMDLVNFIYYDSTFFGFFMLFPIFLEEILERREIYSESMIVRHKSFKEIFGREIKNIFLKNCVYMLIIIVSIFSVIKLLGESPNIINWNVEESFFVKSGNPSTNNLGLTVTLFFTAIFLINFLVSFITKLGHFYNRNFYQGFVYCFIMMVLDILGLNFFKKMIFPVVGFSKGFVVSITSQFIILLLIILLTKLFERKGKERYLDNIIKFKNMD